MPFWTPGSLGGGFIRAGGPAATYYIAMESSGNLLMESSGTLMQERTAQVGEINFTSASWQTDSSVQGTHTFHAASPYTAATIKDTLGQLGTVWEMQFPAGSYDPANTPIGGDGFQATFGMSGKRALGLDYKVYFPTGFDFVKGGKLPGFYGGNTDNASGGTQGTDAFSTRLMWRTSGAGELYAYFPDRSGAWAGGEQNNGVSVGRGNFTFGTGAWHQMRQTVDLDTATVNVYYDDMITPKITLSGYTLELAGHPLTIDGLWVISFYGGSDSTWAPATDQTLYLADFRIWQTT